MRGNDHIAISAGSGFLLAFPWLHTYPIPVAIFLAGVIIGSLLPDTDATDSRLHYMHGIARVFSLIMRPLVMRLTQLVFWIIRIPFDPAHRGTMHTLPGILTYTLLLALLAGSPLYLLGVSHAIILSFFAGIFAGGVFHLLEDCCTQSGLTPLKPFSWKKYAGRISTRDRREKRPGIFAQAFFVSSAAVLAATVYYRLEEVLITGLSMTLFILNWVVIMIVSRW